MSDVCGDNRFEIIEAYKKKLIEDTNIESRPDEMAVIDNILLRFWQMGWLPDFQDTNVGDTIYRQAAIDAVSKACEECRGTFARCKEKLLALPSAEPTYEAVKEYCQKRCLSLVGNGFFYRLSSVQPSYSCSHEKDAQPRMKGKRMRLIDADALEELFREVIGGIAKKPEMNGNLEHMVRASAMVIEMIQDAPTIEQPHWIPTSERNPLDNGHYLCSFSDPNYIDNIYVRLAFWTGGRWYGYAADEITAWMPLPEPWKGKEDGN